MIELVAALLLIGNPAGERTGTVSSGVQNPDRMICRQRVATGSRLRSTRTCMTAREWNQRREEIARGMRDYTTREMASQPPPAITPGSE